MNARAQQLAERRKVVKERLQAAWTEAQWSMKKFYDKKRAQRVFAVGNLVMLSSKNIALKQPSRKLVDKFLGPFKVLQRVGQNAYRLKLPQRYRSISPTFHVSLLELY
jgi:hypothetical protein